MIDPITTAVSGDNSDLFPRALSLFVKPGSRIIDLTYGKGVFWKKVDESLYEIVKNDLDPERGDHHEDFRNTSFADESFDCVVLDPPYASRSSNKKSLVGAMYNNWQHRLNTVEDMLKFYYDGMTEAKGLLKKGGILFVKCQDEVSGGKQKRNSFSIWRYAIEVLGMIDEDKFVLHQAGQPLMRHDHQFHARKNHSYLWVFRKK